MFMLQLGISNMELFSLVKKIFANTKKVSDTAPTKWYTLRDGLQELNINRVDVSVSVEDLKKLQKLIEEYEEDIRNG